MPKRILIVGLLYCFGGICATWGVLANLLVSRISVNFAVLLLPVGIGLLRGKRSSRWWAKFWIVLGYLLCAALVLIGVLAPDSARATWFDLEMQGREAVPTVMGMSILFFLLLIALQRLLDSEKASSYFMRKSQQDAAAKGGPALPEVWSSAQGASAAHDRHSVIKNRTIWIVHLTAIVLVGVGVCWVSWDSFHRNWRFWQYHSRGQAPVEWTSSETWQSPSYDRNAESDSEKYLLHVVASEDSEILAELKLRILFTVQGDGHPLSIAISDETPRKDGAYAMCSLQQWERYMSDFQVGVVSIPETSRHYVTWPRVESKGSSSSIRGAGIGPCPMIMFSLTNIFIRGEHAKLADTAFLEVQDVRALMVAKKNSPVGMFPGGEQPVSWTIELKPDDPDLPVQKIVVREGEREP